jgi:ectoine hydroxylase-related dioxygenase (phytanoyl-CoA dioxygenase family)
MHINKTTLDKHLTKLENDGFTIIPNVLQQDVVLTLRAELQHAMEEDLKLYPDVFDKGMVHNCMIRGKTLASLLDNKIINYFFRKMVSKTCILYAYQSSSLPPQGTNYSSRIHVDCPRFIPNYTTNVGALVALDDFTLDNGATYFLPGSHKSSEVPSEDYFMKYAVSALCKAGSLMIFNSRTWHRGGTNNTSSFRHGLTLGACHSYMRQRFDFPRLMTQEQISFLGEDGKRLIGMNVRMPTSLDEFYLPEEKRLYKSNQG